MEEKEAVAAIALVGVKGSSEAARRFPLAGGGGGGRSKKETGKKESKFAPPSPLVA